MKSQMIVCLTVLFLIAAGLFFWSGSERRVASAQQLPDERLADGGGPFEFEPRDEITEQQRAEIQRNIRENIAELDRSGRLAPARPEVVALAWPVRKAPGVADFNIEGISNFVDQNPAFPNQLRDWNCGNRTYDQPSGYNHSGIDIFTWPFSWKKMDFNEVEVVAAAPGQIVFRSDGNFDRNCGFGSGQWNAIYVRHSDNSVAWYGHMKNGSVTSKGVGATVVTGERLGVVGSSGNSTGPHLHFELYNAANQLQDPYQGTCNTLNTVSWWAAQEPYRVSRVNKLMTHSAGPSFNTCPAQETTNEKNIFKPGDLLVTAAYFRDQLANQQTQYSLIRPDGSAFESFSHTSPQTYSASYWFFNRPLPTNAQRGTWKLRAVFNGSTYEHAFRVGAGVPFDYDADGKTDISVFRPSNAGWYVQGSMAGFSGVQFGIATDRIVPADYDGDGKTDVAVYRPSDRVWYVLNSSNSSISYHNFGLSDDIPAPGDFDADGKADISVFRASTGNWYRTNSSTGAFVAFQFGTNGDKPTVGDYDGDGKADISVFRPSNGGWYRINSLTGLFAGEQFGLGSDIVVPADYDGDGRTDIAVYRPSSGYWYIRNAVNASFAAFNFGLPNDIPTAGDYDGDGKADLSVFRPSDGNWYRQNSSNGSFFAFHFGQNGDRPTPSAFN